MKRRALLYGATGYTGRLLAADLRQQGFDLVLAGRDGPAVERLAASLALPFRVFTLTDNFDDALSDIAVVVHAAGPFGVTAAPMMAGCIRTGTHYLDVTGEWPVFQDATERSAAAAARGTMLMPGVGFAIVASDCLLALAARALPEVRILRLATSRAAMLARGSVRSAAGLTSTTVVLRRGGVLSTEPVGTTQRYFDFGNGPRAAAAVSWPDVVTGAITTGVDTIETYSEVDWLELATYRLCSAATPWLRSTAGRSWSSLVSRAWTPTPSEDARAKSGFTLVAEATDRWKRSVALRMRTPDGYTVTVLTVREILRRVLDGAVEPGFRTPAGLFGGGFIQSLGCATVETAPI